MSRAIRAEGRARGVWVNAADDAEHCDFLLPAVLRRGALAVAVSSGGASPALTRAVRDELERYFPADFGGFVEVVAEVRRELRERGAPVTAEGVAVRAGGRAARMVERERGGRRGGWRRRAPPLAAGGRVMRGGPGSRSTGCRRGK